MICGVIFDLDGTLLNTIDDLYESVNYALSEFNYPQKTLEEVKNAVGNGVFKLIKRVIPGGTENKNFDRCMDLFKKHYSQNMYNKTTPYPGILEMLKELRLKGYHTGVVSNKFDAAVKELCKKYFGDLVQIAIGENEEGGIRKKPAPDSVFKAMYELKVNIDNVIYVGDSETDVQTANNAEIDCIGCTWGFRSREILEEQGAKYIVSSPDEILRIVGVK